MSKRRLFPRVAEAEALRAVDRQLALLLQRSAENEAEGDLLAVTGALVSKLRGEGHACLHLDRWGGRSLGRDGAVRLPSRDAWRTVLEQSSLVAVAPDDRTAVRPLVLDAADRIYLWRYWQAEQRLGKRLARRAALGKDGEPGPPPAHRLSESAELFGRLFPRAGTFLSPGGELDWQAVAAVAALTRSFALVSGGPGTGKTTTVTRILALLAARDPEVRIALAAPTGKAAGRLEESIAEQLTDLPVEPEIRGRIPRQARTLHRLLGYSPRTDTFRRRGDAPLPLDVLVVDEASMVDLLMMDCLVEALPPRAQLILLGDRDQLASVDAGFVFGDLTRAAGLAADSGLPSRLELDLRRLLGEELPPEPSNVALDSPDDPSDDPSHDSPGPSAIPLAGTAVELRTSYRFRDSPGIGELARAVRAGDERRALIALEDPRWADVTLHSLPSANRARSLLDPVAEAIAAVPAAPGPAAALERLASFRILSPTRVGPWGTERLNQLAESRLAPQGTERFYKGRPVLVESNDYGARLYNGDLGILWPEDGGLWAFFPEESATPSDGLPGSPRDTFSGGLRRLPLAKLPTFSTAWAMTVHKSQGSEFDHVLLVLPERDPGDLLSRELLYTGVTRARRRVDVAGPASVLEAAVGRSGRRSSGLVDALRAASHRLRSTI